MQQGTITLITAVLKRDSKSASCCCTIGQTPKDVEVLKQAIKECGFDVQVVDLTAPDQFDSLNEVLRKQVEKVLVLYGAYAFPMLALDGSLIAIGIAEPSQVTEALSEALQREVAEP